MQVFGGTPCSWEVAILATQVFVPFCASEEPSGFVLTCTLKGWLWGLPFCHVQRGQSQYHKSLTSTYHLTNHVGTKATSKFRVFVFHLPLALRCEPLLMIVLYLNCMKFVVFLQLGHQRRLKKALNLECQFFPAFDIQTYWNKNVLLLPRKIIFTSVLLNSNTRYYLSIFHFQ